VRPNLRHAFQFTATTRRTFTSACLCVCAPGRTLAAVPRGTLIIASETRRATNQRRMRWIHRHGLARRDHSNEGQRPSREHADRPGVRLASGVSSVPLGWSHSGPARRPSAPGRRSGRPHLRLEQLPDLASDRCKQRAEREANQGGQPKRQACSNGDPYPHWRSATLSA
jgi:hypothetical protein